MRIANIVDFERSPKTTRHAVQTLTDGKKTMPLCKYTTAQRRHPLLITKLRLLPWLKRLQFVVEYYLDAANLGAKKISNLILERILTSFEIFHNSFRSSTFADTNNDSKSRNGSRASNWSVQLHIDVCEPTRTKILLERTTSTIVFGRLEDHHPPSNILFADDRPQLLDLTASSISSAITDNLLSTLSGCSSQEFNQGSSLPSPHHHETSEAAATTSKERRSGPLKMT